MDEGAGDKGNSGLPAAWSRNSAAPRNFFRLAHLRKLRGCEKVAAVCFRIRGGQIEFLLVQTRSGKRWTFPKGSAEPGLTHAQAAALEAFEEAGVHGRMEEASFTQYIRRKRGAVRSPAAKPQKETAVKAHLCEVLRLSPPEELDRHPTWFSPEKAKLRLRQDRPGDFADELARVVERAVARIRRLRTEAKPAFEGQLAVPKQNVLKKDALQKVTFINDIRASPSRAKAARL